MRDLVTVVASDGLGLGCVPRNYSCFLELFQDQHQLEHFSNAVGVAPTDPRELLALRVPAVESQTSPNAA